MATTSAKDWAIQWAVYLEKCPWLTSWSSGSSGCQWQHWDSLSCAWCFWHCGAVLLPEPKGWLCSAHGTLRNRAPCCQGQWQGKKKTHTLLFICSCTQLEWEQYRLGKTNGPPWISSFISSPACSSIHALSACVCTRAILAMLCVWTGRLCLRRPSALQWGGLLKSGSICFPVSLTFWQSWCGQWQQWSDESSGAPISHLAARWQLPGGWSGSACCSVCPSPSDCSASRSWSWRRAPDFTVLEICWLWVKCESISGQCLEGVQSLSTHAAWRLFIGEFTPFLQENQTAHEAACWSALACSPNA